MKNELKKIKIGAKSSPASHGWRIPHCWRKKTLMTEQEKLKAQTLMELLLLWGKITIKIVQIWIWVLIQL